MIYHLAEAADWQEALREGAYRRSTRGRSLDDEGFIHASSAEQWPGVRRRFYADLTEPLVLLHVDEARLGSRVVHEVGDPATGETFPHVYGPIEVHAVVETTLLPPPHA
jgi:glutathione S-transferase